MSNYLITIPTQLTPNQVEQLKSCLDDWKVRRSIESTEPARADLELNTSNLRTFFNDLQEAKVIKLKGGNKNA